MIGAAAVTAALAAEGLATYVVAEWIAAAYPEGRQSAPGAWAFLLVAIAAFAVPRAARIFDLSLGAARVLAAMAAFVVIYGLLRLEFAGDLSIWDGRWVGNFMQDVSSTTDRGGRALVAAILFVALWIRSTVRSDDAVELEFIPRAIGIPFTVVTAIVVLAVPTERAAEVARGGAAFYAVAVLALACSQLALSGATIGEVRAGGVTAALLGGTVAATVACVVVFGLFFGVVAPILGPPLGLVVEKILVLILTPPAWLIEKIVQLLLGGHNPMEGILQATRTGATNAKNGEPSDGSPPWWATAGVYLLRAIALFVILGTIVAAVAVFARVRRRFREERTEQATVSQAGSLGDDARMLFRSLFGRRRRPGPGGAGVIRLYQEMLVKAEHSGFVREPGATPSEFAPTLHSAFQTPVTDEITLAFEEARYAGRDPDPRTLADLERRWREGMKQEA